MAQHGTFTILKDGNMGESSLYSKTVDLKKVNTFKVVVTWAQGSGTPVGELTLESTTDRKTYELIPFSNQTIADDTGFHVWHFPYNPVSLIRAKYTRSQGLGTMQMFIEIGAGE